MNYASPSDVQTIQRFNRFEFDLSLNNYHTDSSENRYVDIEFQGDTLYIPPESAAVGVVVYHNSRSNDVQRKAPILYPGGAVEGLFQFCRVVLPPFSASPGGTVIVIVSRGMRFSSGSILVNAPESFVASPQQAFAPSSGSGWISYLSPPPDITYQLLLNFPTATENQIRLTASIPTTSPQCKLMVGFAGAGGPTDWEGFLMVANSVEVFTLPKDADKKRVWARPTEAVTGAFLHICLGNGL